MNRTVAIVFLFLLPVITKAQALNSPSQFSVFKTAIAESYMYFPIGKKDTVISLTHKKHSPKKAAIFSAIVPGSGQVYNHKYWKVPLFYAGLIGAGWFVNKNRNEMLDRQNALKAMLDGDPTTVPAAAYANTPQVQLVADRNFYRANRDYGIIALAIIYVINIADATVDAHFYNFNIDKPLAQQKTRHWNFTASKVQNKPTIGLAFTF